MCRKSLLIICLQDNGKEVICHTPKVLNQRVNCTLIKNEQAVVRCLFVFLLVQLHPFTGQAHSSMLAPLRHFL